MAKKIKESSINQKKILSAELSFWSKKWKITGRQIGGAKRAVGSDSSSKIEKYLRTNGIIK